MHVKLNQPQELDTSRINVDLDSLSKLGSIKRAIAQYLIYLSRNSLSDSELRLRLELSPHIFALDWCYQCFLIWDLINHETKET